MTNEMVTFQEQVNRNKLKTGLLFVGFLVFIVGIIALLLFLLTGGIDLISIGVGAAAATISLLVTYFTAPKVALMVSHAEEVTSENEPVLYNVVEEMALAGGTPMPRVYVMRKEAGLNAFATGKNVKDGHVVVTQGLLNTLNREELQGVIAHEISHLKNEDIKLMTMAAAMASVIGVITALAFRFFFIMGRNRNSNPAMLIIIIVSLVLIAVLAPFMAAVIQSAISRKREALADASAVALTRNPRGLESALTSISTGGSVVDSAKPERAHMFFSNPLKGTRKVLDKMFSTHPPIEERIELLQRYQQG